MGSARIASRAAHRGASAAPNTESLHRGAVQTKHPCFPSEGGSHPLGVSRWPLPPSTALDSSCPISGHGSWRLQSSPLTNGSRRCAMTIQDGSPWPRPLRATELLGGVVRPCFLRRNNALLIGGGPRSRVLRANCGLSGRATAVGGRNATRPSEAMQKAMAQQKTESRNLRGSRPAFRTLTHRRAADFRTESSRVPSGNPDGTRPARRNWHNRRRCADGAKPGRARPAKPQLGEIPSEEFARS